MAIVRAESLWEIPVLGRLLAAGAEKRSVAAQQETEEFFASLGQWEGDDAPAGPKRARPHHPRARRRGRAAGHRHRRRRAA